MQIRETVWYARQNTLGYWGWVCSLRTHEVDPMSLLLQNPNFSTGMPPDPPGMRGHAWGPERDDLDTQTCTAPLAHPVAWWWRRRWACALNAYGKRCDLRRPHGWLELYKWRETHCSGRQCIVETCRPGTRETSLDLASCSR